jgi:hypothetical protein
MTKFPVRAGGAGSGAHAHAALVALGARRRPGGPLPVQLLAKHHRGAARCLYTAVPPMLGDGCNAQWQLRHRQWLAVAGCQSTLLPLCLRQMFQMSFVQFPMRLQVEASTGSRGPRLTAVDVPGVGVTAVAHRMSADEHIKVIGETRNSK